MQFPILTPRLPDTSMMYRGCRVHTTQYTLQTTYLRILELGKVCAHTVCKCMQGDSKCVRLTLKFICCIAGVAQVYVNIHSYRYSRRSPALGIKSRFSMKPHVCCP